MIGRLRAWLFSAGWTRFLARTDQAVHTTPAPVLDRAAPLPEVDSAMASPALGRSGIATAAEVAFPHDASPSSPSGISLWVSVLVWILIATTFASFRERHGSELFDAGGIDEQVVFQMVSWLGLGALATWLIATGRADLRLLRRGPLFWYCSFLAVALLSAVYSPAPQLTVYRALQQGVAVVLVISLREQLRAVYLFITVYLAINWVLVILMLTGLHGNLEWIRGTAEGLKLLAGDSDTRWRFASAYGAPSYTSVVAASGACGMAVRAWSTHPRLRAGFIAWCIVTTLLTVSRAAIAGMVAGLAFAAAGRRTLLVWACALAVAVPLVFILPGVADFAERYLTRGQTVSELESLTGRTELYEEAHRRIERSWPFGMGFQSGRVDPLGEDNVAMAHAHNMFLEAATEMGLAGVLSVGLVVLSSAWAAGWLVLRGRGPSRALGLECAGMLMPVAAFCVLDSGFATAVNQVVMLTLVILARLQSALLEEQQLPRLLD
jgi:hypothetical protein